MDRLHIPTHILSGWCVGNLVPLGPRERLFCMVAASVADVDGLGMLAGQEFYWDYHHVLAHNLAFAVLVSLILAACSTRRVLAFVTYLALAHLHLLLDYYGSGPDWRIGYLWPFDRVHAHGWLNPHAWELSSWQNTAAAVVLLVWTVAIARFHRRTPLELLMPSLDQRLLNRGRTAAPAGNISDR